MAVVEHGPVLHLASLDRDLVAVLDAEVADGVVVERALDRVAADRAHVDPDELAGAAAGVEWRLVHQGQVRGWRPYPLVYLGLALAFAAWWLTVPRWPRTFTPDVESIGRNTLMYLQALLWPIALSWRWAPAGSSR